MPPGTSNNHEKESLPMRLFTRILEVFEGKMVGEIEEKQLTESRKKHIRSLTKERREIARRLKAIQMHWDEIEENKKD